MGYETKMYLVEQTDIKSMDEDGAKWCAVIGSVELSKMGYHSKLANIDEDRPVTPEVYIYGTDGNTKITEDCYGRPLGVYDPQVILDAMQADNKGEPYRRFDIGIALLKAAIGRFDRLKVLFYGH